MGLDQGAYGGATVKASNIYSNDANIGKLSRRASKKAARGCHRYRIQLGLCLWACICCRDVSVSKLPCVASMRLELQDKARISKLGVQTARKYIDGHGRRRCVGVSTALKASQSEPRQWMCVICLA